MDTYSEHGPECSDEFCEHESCLAAYVAATRNSDERLGLHPLMRQVPERDE